MKAKIKTYSMTPVVEEKLRKLCYWMHIPVMSQVLATLIEREYKALKLRREELGLDQDPEGDVE